MNNTETNTEFNKACNKANRVIDDVASRAGQLGSEVKEAAETARDKISDAASDAADSTNQVFNKVGERISLAANKLKDCAPDGQLGNAANSVADTLQVSGKYMASHKISDLGSELTGVVKKHPIPTLCIGFGLGLILGSSLTRR
jgi:ElaB/YqjD/DUF883 family membrane-anchored ribosome-binding protein